MGTKASRGRRALPWLVLAIAGCGRPSPQGIPGIRPGHTSVLLVIVDTLRADHLGAWGYPHDTSPGLDRLASEGVVFEQTYSNAPWTRPSVASMLTGEYPRTTGIQEERFDRLPDDLTTLAERFGRAGYLTLGLTANPNVDAQFGFSQGFEAYGDSGGEWDWMPGADPDAAEPLEDARRVTDRTLALVDRHASGLARRPFYLQVLYVDPHTPYAPPRHHRDALDSSTPDYDGEIRHVDAELTRLLEGLRQRGWLEDALVVVTSDHGEGLDSHGRLPNAGIHGYTLYDSVAHVPLLFWHPRLAPARVDALTELIDLAPTLDELLGLAAERLPGHSLVPFLRDAHHPPLTEAVFSETDWRFVSKLSVRTATHRYVRNAGAARFRADGSYEGRAPRALVSQHFRVLPDEALYERGAGSPFEHPRVDDVLADFPGQAARMRRALDDWTRDHPVRPPENRSPEDAVTLGDGTVVPVSDATSGATIDERTQARLRALGYLGDE